MERSEKPTKIPLNVLEDMKNHGAKVRKLKGEDLYSICNIVFKDKAWEIFERWVNTVEADPRVGIGFFPSQNIIGTTKCPHDAIVAPIIREASSIVHYYAPLKEEKLEEDVLPEIGPPLRAPMAFIRVKHSTIALSKLMERIQNPPINYPTLTSLPSGSYICTVSQLWSNAGVDIILFKP